MRIVRRSVMMAVLALIALGCTGSDETPGDGAAVDGTSTSGSSVDGAPEPSTPETTPTSQGVVVAMHPSGVQVQVSSIEFAEASTEAELRVINGREFDTTLNLDRHQTVLVAADGTEFEPMSIPVVDLAETEIADLTLSFPPVDPAAGPFRLLFGYHDNDQGIDDTSPGFDIGPIEPGAAPTPLPDPFGIGDTASHEFGMQVNIAGVTFTDVSIGLAIEVINNGRQAASLSQSRYASFLEDDLGNRYPLELTPGEYGIRVDDGERQPGVLVYAGRIHPDAATIQGVFNDDGNPDGAQLRPRMTFGPYALDGSTPAAGGPLTPVEVAESATHPNGAEFSVNGLIFSETGTVVDLVVENRYRLPIRLALANKTFLLDDLGNRYALLPPDGNESLLIEIGEGLDAELSFPGAINLDASTIEVVFNEGEDGEREPVENAFPEIRFGPYDLIRGEATVGSPAASVPAVSSLGVEALEASSAEALTLIFDEFDGRVVPEGVQLTLPQDILFDSGSDQLRSSASDAIEKVVLIAEYYTDDPIVVIGHTDNEGDDAFNQDLSERRAANVAAALRAAGVEPGLLSTEGLGEGEPVADNDSAEGRQANRRVEIVFVTTKGLPE